MARVVIIEDEPELRAMIAEEIADLGHEVHVASDGEEGLALIRAKAPSIICSDINMPRMNGFELRRRLEAEGLITSATTFIFISANSTKADVADGLMMGAEYYFTKPIDFEKLAVVVTRCAAAA